jgi:hypothetical protein
VLTTQPSAGASAHYSWTASHVAFGASAVITWTLTYGGSSPDTYSVAVSTDLLDSGQYWPTCEKLSPAFGFTASGSWVLDVIGSAPIGVRASAFWFGRVIDLPSNLFSQVSESVITGEDAAMSVSWQSRSISPFGTDSISLFVRWRSASDSREYQPVVLITSVSESAFLDDTLVIGCMTYSEAEESLTVLVTLDDDSSTIVQGESGSGWRSQISVALWLFEIGVGPHFLTVWGLSDSGQWAAHNPRIAFTVVDNSTAFNLSVIPYTKPDPVPTVTGKPRITPTAPGPSPTAPGPSPTATPSSAARVDDDSEFEDAMRAIGILTILSVGAFMVLCTICCACCGWRAGEPKAKGRRHRHDDEDSVAV